jgi:GT2 family glycosyltransferase
MANLSVVIPVFNQLDYTAKCLNTLNQADVPDSQIVVINNGSMDGTGPYLAGRKDLLVISNEVNRGCSFAWNQGVEARVATWTVLLNNDVIVPVGWKEGMLGFAMEAKCDIVSPAQCDGMQDYDFAEFSDKFVSSMQAAVRWGVASGVCFMVHRRVFDKIGLFDTKLGQAGYEDEDFFRRAEQAGFKLGITGRAFLHHFGSITQKSVKAAKGLANSERLGNRQYFREKHRLSWFHRRRDRFMERIRRFFWRRKELKRSGFTLSLARYRGQWFYR